MEIFCCSMEMHPFVSLLRYYTALVEGDMSEVKKWSVYLGINAYFSNGMIIFCLSLTLMWIPILMPWHFLVLIAAVITTLVWFAFAMETHICWWLVVSGNCSICQFFEESMTTRVELEPPYELARCSCIAQVNDSVGECLRPDSSEGADVIDRPGIRPLHIACSRAQLPVVQFLLQRGAAVNVVTFNHSLTPLQVTESIHVLVYYTCMRVTPNYWQESYPQTFFTIY